MFLKTLTWNWEITSGEGKRLKISIYFFLTFGLEKMIYLKKNCDSFKYIISVAYGCDGHNVLMCLIF